MLQLDLWHSCSKMTQCHHAYTRIGTTSFTKSVSTSSRLRLNTAFICSSETGSLVLSLMLRAAMRNIWQIKKQSINFEWLEPRHYFIKRWNMIIWVSVILNVTVVDSDWCFDNLSWSHLQSQCKCITSVFNSGYWPDWSFKLWHNWLSSHSSINISCIG